MLSSVEQAFVGREEIRAALKTPAWEARVKMNSTNWPAPNVWIFIAQLVEHCSPKTEAMGLNPLEVEIFFQVNLQLLIFQ